MGIDEAAQREEQYENVPERILHGKERARKYEHLSRKNYCIQDVQCHGHKQPGVRQIAPEAPDTSINK